MPSNLVDSEEDEEKWEKAKEKAEEQGHGDDYPYIVSIYKNMCPDGISSDNLPDHCSSNKESTKRRSIMDRQSRQFGDLHKKARELMKITREFEDKLTTEDVLNMEWDRLREDLMSHTYDPIVEGKTRRASIRKAWRIFDKLERQWDQAQAWIDDDRRRKELQNLLYDISNAITQLEQALEQRGMEASSRANQKIDRALNELETRAASVKRGESPRQLVEGIRSLEKVSFRDIPKSQMSENKKVVRSAWEEEMEGELNGVEFSAGDFYGKPTARVPHPDRVGSKAYILKYSGEDMVRLQDKEKGRTVQSWQIDLKGAEHGRREDLNEDYELTQREAIETVKKMKEYISNKVR